jgi:hypothetical protein
MSQAIMGRGDGGFKTNTVYKFRVLAVNKYGKAGTLSAPVEFQTDATDTPPMPPKWRDPPFVQKGHPRNSTSPQWRAALDDGGSPIVKYNVYYRIKGSEAAHNMTTVTTDSPVIGPLPSATAFEWQITSVNEKGLESQKSEIEYIENEKTSHNANHKL